jgi:peptidoglycan/LPS O-acetylase OafA/YrhL
MGSDNKRLRNIEFLRGLAALWVVAVHARMMSWIGIHAQREQWQSIGALDHALALLTFPLSWGEFGVPLFFVISGYVIHLPQARTALRPQAFAFDTIQFYARRAVKLYPALVVTLLLTAGLDWATLRHESPHAPWPASLSWVTAAGQLLGVQNLLVPCFGSNGALWTLALEMHFYLVYPVVLWLLRRWGWPTLLTVSLALAALSAWLIFPLGIKWFMAYHPAWLIGAWLAERHTQSDQPAMKRSTMWAMSLIGVLGGLWCRHRFEHGMVLFWSLPALCMVESTRNWQPGHALLRGIERLGAASYSIYLVHVPLLVFLTTVVLGKHVFPSPWPSLALMVPCVVLGWLLYRLVEAPLNEAGQRWLKAAKFGKADSPGSAKA